MYISSVWWCIWYLLVFVFVYSSFYLYLSHWFGVAPWILVSFISRWTLLADSIPLVICIGESSKPHTTTSKSNKLDSMYILYTIGVLCIQCITICNRCVRERSRSPSILSSFSLSFVLLVFSMFSFDLRSAQHRVHKLTVEIYHSYVRSLKFFVCAQQRDNVLLFFSSVFCCRCSVYFALTSLFARTFDRKLGVLFNGSHRYLNISKRHE